MKARLSLALLLLTVCATGCESVPVDSYCLADREIRLTDSDLDMLSDEGVREVYTHNCRLFKACYPDLYEEQCQ